MAGIRIIFLWVAFIPLIGFPQVFHRKINQWDDKFKMHGLWITWQDEEKKIPYHKIRYNHGVEYKVTRYYHSNGKVRLRYRFIGDSIVKVKYFDSTGHLTDKGRALRLITNEEYRFCWDGKWKQFGEHHKLLKTSYFRKGEELISNQKQ